MVRLNKIYTRTGDRGTTGLGTGERRPKHDLRVEAFGTVDEANAAIGNKVKPPDNLPVDYSPTASGGFAVKLLNGGLKWSFPVNVPQDGYYQLMLNLSGGKAYGGYASLGVYVDGKNEALTTSRIASTQWHRIPAGKPFQLTAGDRIVSVGLLNQVYGAKKENRFCLPFTRFLLHQPLGGVRGQVSDITIEAEEIIKMRARLIREISVETGQPYEKVVADTERNFWMGAEDAVKYGLAAKVISSASEV